MQINQLYRRLSSVAILSVAIVVPATAQAESLSTAQSSSSSSLRPFTELTTAAQRLRDATHELVRERASPERNQAIQKIDRSLMEVQNAIVSLPSDLLLADANASPSEKATDDLARA